jgi:hypothetical protein
MAPSVLSIRKHFAGLRDPRLNRRKRHLLPDILAIAVCAVIAGANNFPQIEAFGLLAQALEDRQAGDRDRPPALPHLLGQQGQLADLAEHVTRRDFGHGAPTGPDGHWDRPARSSRCISVGLLP